MFNNPQGQRFWSQETNIKILHRAITIANCSSTKFYSDFINALIFKLFFGLKAKANTRKLYL